MLKKILAWCGFIGAVALVVALNRGAVGWLTGSSPKPAAQRTEARPGQDYSNRQQPRGNPGHPPPNALDRQFAEFDKFSYDCYMKNIKSACAEMEAMERRMDAQNRRIDAMGAVMDARAKGQLDSNRAHQRQMNLRDRENSGKQRRSAENERDRLIRQGDYSGARGMEEQRKYHQQQAEQARKQLNRN